MNKGMLRVIGTLDVAQFWPSGGSDADTLTVKVTANSFEFSSNPAQNPFQVTHVFEGAIVKGKQSKAAIHGGKITIRLQGIDATELHYAATLPGKGLKNNGTKFRQFLAETATTKLRDFIGKSNTQTVDCEVTSAVDHPNDVFDTFGRFIGDVIVTKGTKRVNINHWLVQNGWAFPTYYNSMSKAEISALRKLADAAKQGKKGMWPHLIRHVGQLNLGMIFRPKGVPNKNADVGRVLMPKIFRRQVKLAVSQLNQLFIGDFKEFLATQKDPFVRTADFMKNPAIKPPKKNSNLSVLIDKHDNFTVDPGDIVFFEQPSTLLDANHKKITSWGLG